MRNRCLVPSNIHISKKDSTKGILIFDNIMFIDLTPYNRKCEKENSFAFLNILFQHNFEAGKEGQNQWGKVREVRVVRFTFEPSHVFFFKQPGMDRYLNRARQKLLRFENIFFMMNSYNKARLAEVGSLSARSKIAAKIFTKHIFTIFAKNASFLHVIANLQI